MYLNLNDYWENFISKEISLCFHYEMIYLYIRIQSPLPVFAIHISNFS